MTELTERIAHLNGVSTTPSDQIVAADLARGRAALARRRRTRASLSGVGLTLVVGTGLGAVVASEQVEPAPGVDLVAYEGKQPSGFHVAKVPDGFVVQDANPFRLTIAREGDTTHPDGFADKLVVMLESGLAAPHRLDGDPVSVNGHAGAVRDSGETLDLEFHDGTHEVVVQMWDSVGLSSAEVVEFAEGITVSPLAKREEPAPGSSGRTVERDGGQWRIVR